MQVLAQDIANKNASAGGSQARGHSALVDLDKGAPFKCNGLLHPKAALGNQWVAKFGQHRSADAIDACRNAIFAMGPGGTRCGKQSLKAAEWANKVNAAWE